MGRKITRKNSTERNTMRKYYIREIETELSFKEKLIDDLKHDNLLDFWEKNILLSEQLTKVAKLKIRLADLQNKLEENI